MRKTVPMTFGQLWEDFLRTSPAVSRKLAEARAGEVWAAVAGPAVASRTLSVDVVRGVMYVKISSAVARNDVFMRRETLKDAINEALGVKVVNVLIVK